MAWPAQLEAADRATQKILGGTVLYAPRDGADAVEVPGIFDAVYVRADAGLTGVSSSGPAVFVRLSDLSSDPAADDDAIVTVEGVEYTVREVEKDGQGGVLLRLHRREDQ